MLLTLGSNASIGGTPGVTNMIRINGALSDLGIRKIILPVLLHLLSPLVSAENTPANLNVTAHLCRNKPWQLNL
jgi:hypothetical protein